MRLIVDGITATTVTTVTIAMVINIVMIVEAEIIMNEVIVIAIIMVIDKVREELNLEVETINTAARTTILIIFPHTLQQRETHLPVEISALLLADKRNKPSHNRYIFSNQNLNHQQLLYLDGFRIPEMSLKQISMKE